MSAFLVPQLMEGERINAKRLHICNVYHDLLQPLASRIVAMLPKVHALLKRDTVP
jgi:hypothetical protein